MKKQGAVELGVGGDGSAGGIGTFFEGAITSGNPPDAIEDALQVNIVAAGYGR
jgi:non-reducing end alpha-L-arabinofuranosidase